MNITVLIDRSYRSAMCATDSTRMYKFLSDLVMRLSFKTKNKFRFGAYGSTVAFLCPIYKTDKENNTRPVDFVYQLKGHVDTPHYTWTPDFKAELVFLLKGQPFQTEGYNNVREVLNQITQEGSDRVKADHVVIISCWPMFENSDWLTVMRQTASVSLVNLNHHWVTPDKVAKKLQKMTEKTTVIQKTRTLTPYEELHVSMLRFLSERAPVLLKETYGF